MPSMIPYIVAPILGTLLLTLVYLHLYGEYRERYLGIWGASWGVYTLQGVLALAAASAGESRLLSAAHYVAALANGLLLMWGTLVFAGRQLSRGWVAVFAAGAAWVLAATALRLSFLSVTLPVYAALGVVYIRTGAAFLRYEGMKGLGKAVVGWTLVLWGLHKLDYPFLRPVDWFAPWGFMLSATLALAAALGTILVYFQRTRIELARSEARFRLLAENARDVVYRYRFLPTPGFEYISPAVTAVTGYTPEEHYADPFIAEKIAHPEDRDAVRSTSMNPGTEPYSLRWIAKDGSVVWTEQKSSPVYDEEGNLLAIEGIARDVTERRNLEDLLRQSQKMEAVGRLAGGVAHDFNNLLTVITGYSDLLLRRAGEKEPARRDLEEIHRAGERATALTRQLLAFSRRQVLQPRLLDLNDVVEKLGAMLRRLIGEDVHLVCSPGPGLQLVKADPGQVEQVILNLAVNARDAMPGGGTLAIETANEEIDEATARRVPGAAAGRYVRLAVRDTGCGMDEAVRSHLFEPFFTTKDSGKGTGLGLATVYGIVRQSGGFIRVDSEPGRGSSFTVSLPRAEEPADLLRSVASGAADDFPRGREAVLVAEDEEVVRTLVCNILRSCGYDVVEAQGGEEALAACEARVGRIHLLLTDVVMPRMGGRELAARLASLRPGIRVLYMSGYTGGSAIPGEESGGPAAFIQKPFTPDALARKVREVLDAAPAPSAAPLAPLVP